MQDVQTMLQAHPTPMNLDAQTLADCIQACFDCASTCTSCADACLAEEMVADLRFCIRQDLDCADICNATGRVLSRQTEPDMKILRFQLEACVTACGSCADECEKHAEMHEHCRLCAEACRRCEASCQKVLQALN